MVSIIIPARNEIFLQKTIDSIIENASGEYEIIVGLDGYWPVPPLRDHKYLTIYHVSESIGMRPMINSLVQIAKGKFIMKVDAHCIFGKGFNEILSSTCENNWIVVPRQYSLDDVTWSIDKTKPIVDYWYLSPPSFLPEEELGSRNRGLHAKRWFEFKKRDNRNDLKIDDLMSFQGSCWFMHRDHFKNIEVMDQNSYGNFAYEAVELGMKTWLSGGRVVVNKNTWYAHLHKGKKHGRGYFLGKNSVRESAEYSIKTWMNNTWPKAIYNMKWFIDKFSPVPEWENFDWSKVW